MPITLSGACDTLTHDTHTHTHTHTAHTHTQYAPATSVPMTISGAYATYSRALSRPVKMHARQWIGSRLMMKV